MAELNQFLKKGLSLPEALNATMGNSSVSSSLGAPYLLHNPNDNIVWGKQNIASSHVRTYYNGVCDTGVYKTALNITGSGFLLFAHATTGLGNGEPTIRITVDGVMKTAGTASANYVSIGSVMYQDNPVYTKPTNLTLGASMDDTSKNIARGLCATGIRFDTSLKVEVSAAYAWNPYYLRGYIDYVLDGELQ